MTFNMKYPIKSDYLAKGSKKRPGNNIKVRFIVAHDTGNKGSTAKGNVNYYRNTQNSVHASAHLFVDDKDIIECVPALLGTPERAYHVIYNVTTDNRIYGDDANDAAIGVEFCWGGKIDNSESYKRYVWLLAYLCYRFRLNVEKDIIGHDTLDPSRKIDPSNSLKDLGKTFKDLIADVKKEYNLCAGGASTSVEATPKEGGTTHTIVRGDTLWALSQRYNTTVGKLKILNPELDANSLRVGDTILVAEGDIEVVSPNNKVATLEDYMKTPPVRPYPNKVIRRGAQGDDVKAIQRAIGVNADGIFGSKTEQGVKNYQAKFPFLTVDGVVGVNTWNVMF